MQVFTTGEVSRICKVAPSTVSKWFDSGQLKGYRVPGSQHRRVPRQSLVQFLREHGMPLGELERSADRHILLLTKDAAVLEGLRDELGQDERFRVHAVSSGFEAGIQADSLRPDCVIVDFSSSAMDAAAVSRNLRRNERLSTALLVALLPPGMATPPEEVPVDESFTKPFDPVLLAERLRRLLGRRQQ